eukprot:gene13845-12211_t
MLLQQQHLVNDTVTALSPVPILAISQIGTITKISESTLKAFDYQSYDDIIGKNIKIL